ncbi:MAG: VanW family protein, partial [Beutenbergiaceae bacterium]
GAATAVLTAPAPAVDAGGPGLGMPPTDGSDPAEPSKPRRGSKVGIGIGIGVVVLAGAYFGAGWYFSGKVPPDASVAGVDLSRLSISDAQQRLDAELADEVLDPIPVDLSGSSGIVDPVAAGLELDSGATIASFTGFPLAPQELWGHIVGIGEQPAVVDVDSDALATALETVAAELQVPPVDGAIEFVDGQATVVTEPAEGIALDVPAAAEQLEDTWLTGARPMELPAITAAPTIDQAALDQAMTGIVEPLMSGPVTVVLNEVEASLEPADMVAAAALEPTDTGLQLVLDGAALAAVLTERAPSVGEVPQDAQIVLEGGAPTIIPAVTGTGLQPDQVAQVVGVAALGSSPQERTADAELAQTEAEFSTADAEALGVTEIISEFSTPYPYNPARTQNLINGAEHISGTLVLPGETFSLIDALGAITTANGYRVSPVVIDGRVDDAMGGGLSQISTTTFNAAYEAGMEDVMHRPHTRYFDRYPAGREATMWQPDLDMQWANNTPYGVLVQAWAADGRVNVRLWGTPYWDVEIASSNRYNHTSPRTINESGAGCEAQSAGPGGFSIDITRTVSLDGEVNDTYSDSYSWTYRPVHRVVCDAPEGDG